MASYLSGARASKITPMTGVAHKDEVGIANGPGRRVFNLQASLQSEGAVGAAYTERTTMHSGRTRGALIAEYGCRLGLGG